MPILQKQILSAFTLVVAASAAAQSPKPAITGFVVDAQTKQPLVGAVVRVSGASVSPTAVTDAQGRFAARAAAGVEADISYMGYATQRVKLSAGATSSMVWWSRQQSLSV